MSKTPQKSSPSTDISIAVLTELVRAAGSVVFSSRVARVDEPHIKRCTAAGLVAIESASTLRLTDTGIDRVLVRLFADRARIRTNALRGRLISADIEIARATDAAIDMLTIVKGSR